MFSKFIAKYFIFYGSISQPYHLFYCKKSGQKDKTFYYYFTSNSENVHTFFHISNDPPKQSNVYLTTCYSCQKQPIDKHYFVNDNYDNESSPVLSQSGRGFVVAPPGGGLCSLPEFK